MSTSATSLPYGSRYTFHSGRQQSPSPSTGTPLYTSSPSTTLPLATIYPSTNEDIEAAVNSASDAFQTWSRTPAIERSRILHRAAQILRERNDEIAKQETAETGKPFSETSVVDVVTGADVLEYYANLVGGGGIVGERTMLRDGVWCESTKEAGNTMVYKPSPFTCLHALTLAEIYLFAGLPPGAFNVVYGDADIGSHLTSHPLIAKVSFTGQVSTGKKVATSAAEGLKYMTMELGGKSACIILEDSDIELAVDGAMMANFYSTGQVCTNGTRVFVPRSRQEEFERRLMEKMEFVRWGDLMDPRTNFGPLSSQVHYEKVRKYVRRGIESDRARLLCGGLNRPQGLPEGCEDGWWVLPTVFTDCTDDMEITREEIFGPVMCIMPYDGLDEVVKRANASPLGLAAGVFTKDLNKAHQVVQKLEAGICWVNTWGESPAEMSVGGWKQSGIGVENGRKGIEAWLRNRSTLFDTSGQVATAFSKL